MSAGRRKKPLILRSRDQIFAIYLDHHDIFNLGMKGNLFSQKALLKNRCRMFFFVTYFFLVFHYVNPLISSIRI